VVIFTDERVERSPNSEVRSRKAGNILLSVRLVSDDPWYILPGSLILKALEVG